MTVYISIRRIKYVCLSVVYTLRIQHTRGTYDNQLQRMFFFPLINDVMFYFQLTIVSHTSMTGILPIFSMFSLSKHCRKHIVILLYMAFNKLSYTWPSIYFPMHGLQQTLLYMAFNRLSYTWPSIDTPIHGLQQTLLYMAFNRHSYTWPSIDTPIHGLQQTLIYMAFNRHSNTWPSIDTPIHDLQQTFLYMAFKRHSYT